MAKYHINPNTGTPGPCKAQAGGCPFGGEDEHFASPEEARQAFESTQDTFATVIKKDAKTTTNRSAVISDLSLDASVASAQAQWEQYDPKTKVQVMEDAVAKVETPQWELYQAPPGSPEREAMRESRNAAREELLAYDIVAWRDSEFYNEGVEARMKERVVAVIDADLSIEKALADERGIASAAKQYGVSTRDVENVLETVHADYLKPRNSMAKPISELSSDNNYASTTAYLFRMKPEAVQGILSYASNYSSVKPKSTSLADILAD